ncbi:MAG TPA: DUF4349 domain-containing protein [Thermoanaerobaculia bacterium]|jgi:hypothetical protein|nr:DUF4349 domain-containing protein [Thermoanaerobaculia bacterium]
MRRLRLPLLVSAMVVTAAIGGMVLTRAARGWRSPAEPSTRNAAAFGLARTDSGQSAATPAEPSEPSEPSGGALAARFASLRLIRTASIALEVARYGEAARRAEAVAVAHGGYLADARAWQEADDRERGTLTLRVQADRFDQALRALEALGKVESTSVETQDVGKEYLDLETRLAAKRDTEGRLRDILRTRTAGLADVLAAEKELSRVIEERERLEGERQFYDRQLALSTLTVELHEPTAFVRESAVAPLREALRKALPLLSASVAALLYAVVAALPWVLVGLGIWRLRHRFATRRRIRAVVEG